jgi:dihydroorotase-like cyclic amidohydrolase
MFFKALPAQFQLVYTLFLLFFSTSLIANKLNLHAKNTIELQGEIPKAFVVKNVTIVDTLHDELILNKDVFIYGKKIVSILTHSKDYRYPKNAIIINGESRYLMPGLWDMHVHLSQQEHVDRAGLFIANGVTAVRDMNSDCSVCSPNQLSIKQMKKVNQRINNNELVGPKILAYSSLINGFGLTQNEQNIKRYVEEVKDKEIPFIKTYNDLNKSAYFTLAKAAKAADIGIVGHIPNSVTLIEALTLGHKTIEHAKTIPMYCAGDVTQAKKRSLYQFIDAVNNYDSETCLRSLQAIKSANSFYVPTHLTVKMPAFITQSPDKINLAQRYIPKEFLWLWQQEVKHYEENPAVIKKYQRLYKHTLYITGIANKLGVNIMLGTDANDTYIVPGFSAHEELSELVKAGFSPLEAIKAATIIPARFLKLDEQYGSVNVGKFSDLLLLDDNPLENINNTRSINTIFYNGRIIDKAEMKQIFDTLTLKSNN